MYFLTVASSNVCTNIYFTVPNKDIIIAVIGFYSIKDLLPYYPNLADGKEVQLIHCLVVHCDGVIHQPNGLL